MSNELTTIHTAPDLEQIKALVIDGLNSPNSKTMYALAIRDFLIWYQERGAPGLTKATVNAYKAHLLKATTYAPSTINLRLSAVRRLAVEAADNGLITESQGNGVSMVKGVQGGGVRSGNWLTPQQAQQLIDAPDLTRLKGFRDRAILALLMYTGLRRSELASLRFEDIQQREGRWAIVDLVGKGGYRRTIPISENAKQAIDEWTENAAISEGFIFRAVNKADAITGDNLTSQAIQDVVKEYAAACGFGLAAHDLRRTFARIAYDNGAPMEQIQLSLGHKSIETTRRYINAMQDFKHAPSDYIQLTI